MPQPSYSENRKWSDRFIPAITFIVGPRLLVPAPFDVDTREATDLIVFRARDMAIAARVRRPGFVGKNPFEFTLRSRCASGHKTELAKITDGWGDWMFYGHSAADECGFERWFLIDLHAFRAALIRSAMRPTNRLEWQETPNGDGTFFVPFDLRIFRPSLLIASSHDVPEDMWAA